MRCLPTGWRPGIELVAVALRAPLVCGVSAMVGGWLGAQHSAAVEGLRPRCPWRSISMQWGCIRPMLVSNRVAGPASRALQRHWTPRPQYMCCLWDMCRCGGWIGARWRCFWPPAQRPQRGPAAFLLTVAVTSRLFLPAPAEFLRLRAGSLTAGTPLLPSVGWHMPGMRCCGVVGRNSASWIVVGC